MKIKKVADIENIEHIFKYNTYKIVYKNSNKYTGQLHKRRCISWQKVPLHVQIRKHMKVNGCAIN